MNEENLWKESINSPVFGKCEGLEEGNFRILCVLINLNPIAAFGLLNKKLNKRQMLLSIGEMEKEEAKP